MDVCEIQFHYFLFFVTFIIYGYRKKIHTVRKTMAIRSFYKLEVEEKGVYLEVY